MSDYLRAEIYHHLDLGEVINICDNDDLERVNKVRQAVMQAKLADGLYGRAFHTMLDEESNFGTLYWPNTQESEEQINEVLQRIGKETDPEVYWKMGLLYDKKNLPRSKRNMIMANRKFPWWELRKPVHVDNPEHLWEKLLQSYTAIDPKLEGFKVEWKRARKVRQRFEGFFTIVLNTIYMKGLKIIFEEDDYAKIFDTFAYLTGRREPVEKPREEPKAPVTDPWEVPMPTITEVGR